MERVWIYEATIIRHVDGDTTVMDIDQGMNHWSRNQYIRYAGINAPELSNPDGSGKAALAFLESVLTVGQQVWLATLAYHETEKYGRVLAVVFDVQPAAIPWANADLAAVMPGSVNQEMIDTGHAVAYDPSGI